jgi:replicative DNA helicase
MKIKQVAEDLRGLAVEKDLIIISATQVSRSAYNGDDIKLEDVSESVALNNTCDTILGIIQTPEMYIGDLEDGKDAPQPYYWIKILKIREGAGKNTKFRVNINYDKMKLTEKIDLVDMTSHI